MNCHHARQLISPYLDQQLTGREMLALQDHFAGCLSCQREMQSMRQIKALLRGLREPAAPRDLSSAIAQRLTQSEAEAQRRRVVSLFLPLSLPVLSSLPVLLSQPKPQRGRRLASALAISCLTVLSIALPFGPEAQYAARSFSSGLGPGSSAFETPPPADALLSGRVPERLTLMPGADFTHLSPVEATAAPGPGVLTLTDVNPSPASSLSMPPRDAAFGGVQFAQFHSR